MLKIGNNATRIRQSDIDRLIKEAKPIYQELEQIETALSEHQIPLGYLVMAAQEMGMSQKLVDELSDKMAEMMQTKTHQEALAAWIKNTSE